MKKFQTPKRVLLKLSGEALQGEQGYGIDPNFLSYLAKKIVHLVQKEKLEIAIVVGGGNIFRGIELEKGGFDRATGDNMGMLATMINGIAIGEAIEDAGVDVRVMSAISAHKVAEDFIQRRALRHLQKGRVVICVGGSGNPFFSTDSAAVLRALELQCDAVVKATKVDGIYDKDPKKHSDAVRYEILSLEDAIQKNVRVMDQAAIALAHDECMPIYVCRIEDVDKINTEEIVGTYVCTAKYQKK
ncbi:UMP kinase [Candidatus Gracilibacteria bacterium GN02-873]|nr:UMP kinase [Candidatus Gracilibacteria bacterium GN02-873]